MAKVPAPAHLDVSRMGPDFTGSRDLAEQLRRQRSTAAGMAALGRVVNSAPPTYGPGERGYVSLRDVILDLGLSDAQRVVVQDGLKRIVSESRAMIDVARDLKDVGIEATLIPILLKRGMKLAQEARAAGKAVLKSAPPGAGWEPVPKGRKGGYRRHKPNGGYEYAYPDGESGGHTTGHDEPHAGEHSDVHDEHAAATPDRKVAASYGEVAARAESLGMRIDAKPHAKTTADHVSRLHDLVSRHERARSAKPAKSGDNSAGDNSAGDNSDSPDKPDKPFRPPSSGWTSAPEGIKSPDAGDLIGEIMKLGEQKGVPADALEHAVAVSGEDADDLRTVLDYLDGMPDSTGDGADTPPSTPSEDSAIPGLGHDVPESPHELAALTQRVKALESALAAMEQHLDKHEKALHAKLRQEARLVRRSPSPQAVDWMTSRIKFFAMLALGASAGAILGGPLGVVLGLAAASKVAPAIAKSLSTRVRRPISWGEPVIVDGRIVVLFPRPARMLKARVVVPVPAAPPPPKFLAETNPWGLLPGQKLYVRKGRAWDIEPEVTVLPHAAFSWNGERYLNANALLKAITGKERPGTSIKRYFRLNEGAYQVVKSMAYALGQKFPELHFEAHGGAVRASGALAAHGIPGAGPADHAMVLSVYDAQTILRGDDNG